LVAREGHRAQVGHDARALRHLRATVDGVEHRRRLRSDARVSTHRGGLQARDPQLKVPHSGQVLVEPRAIEAAEGDYFGFETLTFAPIDRTLVDQTLLTRDEVAWWNAYHAKVEALLAPQLSGAALAWLKDACTPL